ncbi:hypothetical protein D6789_00090 [Candidatus Woesearchaeota archaeon]|nr:MAG: hypothetical protein D6789_00090 [Candidatus Woesearchaeota archaeon]
MVSVAVFSPHNDDHVLGMGGTIAKLNKDGDTIYTFIGSFGELSHPHYKPEVIRKARVKEAQRADKLLGGQGNVQFLGLRELKFAEDFTRKGLGEKLVRRLKQLNVKRVYLTTPNDSHPDHKAFTKLLLDTITQHGLSVSVYAYAVYPALRLVSAPRSFVDVSDTYGKKLDALKAFTSQFNPFSYVITNNLVYVFTLIKNAFAGFLRGARHAEVFYKLR